MVNLNWQQGFNDGSTGLVAGRYDPSDYLNALGNSDPWTSFSNIAVLLDASVVFADVSWGIGGGHWFNDQFYMMAGVNDANGVVSDNLEFFDGGSEFYTWGHVGWTPTKADRYTKNLHMAVGHVDEREDLDIDSKTGSGLTFQHYVAGNPSMGMRQFNGHYTQRFNRRHNMVGHLFQGRYKANPGEKRQLFA